MPAYVSLVCLVVGSIGISIWYREFESERWPRVHALGREYWPVLFGFWASLVLLELFAEQARAPIAGWARLTELSTCALVALPIAIAPARARAWVALAVISLLSCLALADLLYGREFGSAIPIELFARAKDAWEVRRAVSSMVEWRQLVFLLVGIAMLVMALLHDPRAFEFSLRRHTIGVLTCAGLAIPALVETRAYARSKESWTVIVPRAALETGIWGAHLIDGWRKIGTHTRRSLAASEIDGMRRELDARRVQGALGSPRRLNVLLLQIESLNAWVLDVELGARPVMPNLRALRDKGVFVRLLDQTGNGRSSDADSLVLTSQHPLPEAPVSIVYAENHVIALPRLLADRGYSTWSFSCDSRDIWQGARRHTRYGIQRASFGPELGVEHQLDCDRPLFQRVAETLKRAKQPFFGWAMTLGMHVPYVPLPAGRPRVATGALSGSVLGNYLDAAHDTDRALGELWAALEASGLGAETVVVIYGDHTTHEPLGEHDDSISLVPEQVRADPFWTKRVPLVLIAPKLVAGERSANAGAIDIAPSVLELLGLPTPRVFLGRSLLENRPEAIAVRWDGDVAGTRAVLRAGSCTTVSGAPLGPDACDALRASGARELSLSFRMTRHDLFQELAKD